MNLQSGTYWNNVKVICSVQSNTVQWEIFASINFCESPTNTAEKKFRNFFFFATRSQCLTAPPTISCMEMVTHSVHFQCRNDSKISTLIKACWLLSVKNCHAKGRELTLRMYLQFDELIVGHKKFPQLLDASTTKQVNFLTIYWICNSKALCSTCQQEHFGGKNFSWEQIL